MKDIEIINEDVEPQHLFAIEKRNDKTLDTESKGIITIEKKYGTIKFERRLSHPKKVSRKAITDAERYSGGCPITKEYLKVTTVVQLILSIHYQDHM